MDQASALVGAMLAAALGGGGFALFLLTRARSAPGAAPLAAFLAVAGLWAVGLLLSDRRGEILMTLAPLGAGVFVHFAARLSCRGGGLIPWSYAVAGAAMAAALADGPGRFIPWKDGALFRYEGAGLAAVGATLLLAGLGHAILFGAWRSAAAKQRRQIGVVMISSMLGLGSAAALAFPLLGIDAYPWTLLLLPLYIVVLAYGVLRYELMAVNHWARRALTWGLLVALAAAVTALPAGLIAKDAPWGLSAVAVAVAMGLWQPVRRLVDSLIFPGGEVAAAEIPAWRAALDIAQDEAEIDRCAESLLRKKLRLPLEGGGMDWRDAPPGPRRVFEAMESVKAEARRDLDRRRSFAERQRLAELGALAATVAHDLRNPMNIIAMAVADAEPATRREVKAQIARMEALVRDLLDYAKPWAVEPVETGLAAAIADAARGLDVTIDVPAGLTVRADPLRLAQALGNLLANGRAAGGRMLVTAERTGDAVMIHVCDDGPGIPEDIRASLFQPFVSRGQNGTGLGLAIVAKVMTAHGGSAALTGRPGWTTCFTLRFPL